MKGLCPAAVLLAVAGSAAAQTESSLTASLGTVQYEGGFTSQALSITPSVRRTGPRSTAGFSVALLFLSDNQWSFQGGPDVRLVTAPFAGPLRLALDGWGSFTSRSYVSTSASGALVGEAVWEAGRSGLSAGGGAASGWLSGADPVVDLRLRGRAWTRLGAVTLIAMAEPTRHLGAWYTDVTAAAALLRPRAELVVSGATRMTGGGAGRGAGTVSLRWYVSPGAGVEVAGGSYLPDPLQGLPRASFLSLGVRVREPWRDRPERVVTPPLLAPRRQGDQVVVRFRFPGARRVEIAGEWTDWSPVALSQTEPGVWQAALQIKPGLYHFNLVVDGAWRVPEGVATVPDQYGGRVAVLLVQ